MDAWIAEPEPLPGILDEWSEESAAEVENVLLQLAMRVADVSSAKRISLDERYKIVVNHRKDAKREYQIDFEYFPNVEGTCDLHVSAVGLGDFVTPEMKKVMVERFPEADYSMEPRTQEFDGVHMWSNVSCRKLSLWYVD